jgi:outer membrane protein assembly factor BamB
MTRAFCALTLAAAVLAGVGWTTGSAEQQSSPAARNWGQWRGPSATGVSTTATPPVEWSETKNVRWKIAIPGRGSASPVVWGDRVYLLTAIAGDGSTAARGGVPHKFVVMAIDRKTGKVVWEQVAREESPHENAHNENGTFASSSAITDGEHVIAPFESRGIYAYDMNGKLVWQKDLGDKRMRSQFGEGSTPALHGNRLIVNWDHQGESFIVALDKRTGDEVWRKSRDEIDSWFTPLVVTVNGRAQVITGAMNRIQSYDLETGEVVWHTAGLTMNPIPSPVAAEGLVVLMSGFRGNSIKVINLANAKGDITGTDAIAWTLDRDAPYVPSPLLYDGILYVMKSNSGVLTAFDAKTGKPHYALQRLDAVPNVFASPVGAAGRVYIPGREGAVVVLKHGTTFEQIGVNTLDDGFDASPALVDGEIYLRGNRNLYCIAEK